MYFLGWDSEGAVNTLRSQKGTGMQSARDVARRFVEALFDPVQPVDDVVAPRVVLHAWPWVNPGATGLSQAREALAHTWDRQVVDVHETLQADGHVVLRVTEHGVHTGRWQGIEPTNKEVATRAIHIVRVVDGSVVEHWRESDDLARLRQLCGEVSPPHIDHDTGEEQQ